MSTAIETPKIRRRAQPRLRTIRREGAGLALASPSFLLLGGLSLAPLGLLFVRSVTSSNGSSFDLEAMQTVLTNQQYRTLMGRSLSTALLVTIVSAAIAWPVAWAIAKVIQPKRRTFVLALIMVPFLTSQLLLIYAMLVQLGAGGPLMNLFDVLHVANSEDSILYTPWATRVMFTYESISVIVMLLFVASERIDEDLLAASRSMGASRIKSFMTVIWAGSSTALTSAAGITFVATAGAFAESAVLGGPRGALIGNVIADRLQTGGRADVSAALAVVLLVLSLICVGILAVVIRRLAHPLRRISLGDVDGRAR